MKLTRRFAGHMRLHRGAVFTYDVMRDGEIVGTAIVTINKNTRPWSESTVYMTDGREFCSLAEFKAAIAAKGPKP